MPVAVRKSRGLPSSTQVSVRRVAPPSRPQLAERRPARSRPAGQAHPRRDRGAPREGPGRPVPSMRCGARPTVHQPAYGTCSSSELQPAASRAPRGSGLRDFEVFVWPFQVGRPSTLMNIREPQATVSAAIENGHQIRPADGHGDCPLATTGCKPASSATASAHPKAAAARLRTRTLPRRVATSANRSLARATLRQEPLNCADSRQATGRVRTRRLVVAIPARRCVVVAQAAVTKTHQRCPWESSGVVSVGALTGAQACRRRDRAWAISRGRQHNRATTGSAARKAHGQSVTLNARSHRPGRSGFEPRGPLRGWPPSNVRAHELVRSLTNLLELPRERVDSRQPGRASGVSVK